MSVFVTGATGVLGRPVVRLLVASGHRVVALSRSPRNAEVLRHLGAEVSRGSLFEPGTLRDAVGASDAVLHLATRIPPSSEMRSTAAWGENDRIRREGTRNLVDAALAGRVARFVYPSVALVYADGADRWIDEDTPVASSRITASTLEAETEVERFSRAGRRGASLRLGRFYGPESAHTRELLPWARRGFAFVPGRDDSYEPLIWIDDAAAAVVAALERAPTGVFNVVDDEPLLRRELIEIIARAAGRRRLLQIPAFLVRLTAGADLAGLAARSQRVSNHRFKEASGWRPQIPSAREGWPAIAAPAGGARRAPAAVR